MLSSSARAGLVFVLLGLASAAVGQSSPSLEPTLKVYDKVRAHWDVGANILEGCGHKILQQESFYPL
jgi:hypothetical protein